MRRRYLLLRIAGEGGKPKNMCEVLDQVEARGEARGIQIGALEVLASLVKDGILAVADAARRANLTPAEFQAKTASYFNRN